MKNILYIALGSLIISGAVRFTDTHAEVDVKKNSSSNHPLGASISKTPSSSYQPKPLEFPPLNSVERVHGILVSVDYIHRSGTYINTQSGELSHFSMPSYGFLRYKNASAVLRDIPLGTKLQFCLNRDEDGRFTRLVCAYDSFSLDAGNSITYRLEEAFPEENKLIVIPSGPDKKVDSIASEWHLNAKTRLWRGDHEIELSELKPGDELLFNVVAPANARNEYISDIWAGEETHHLESLKQEKRFVEHTQVRGLPGWIESIDGDLMTVSLFTGESETFHDIWKSSFNKRTRCKVSVADENLRTFNPPVDGEWSDVVEILEKPVQGFGDGGLQLIMKPNYLLEGFRRGAIVRVFGHTPQSNPNHELTPSWNIIDQPYGEGLMNYGFSHVLAVEFRVNTAQAYPEQFAYRTDYGNRHLPWFQITDDKSPPLFSQHEVCGTLISVADDGKSGCFVAEGSKHETCFQMLDSGAFFLAIKNQPLQKGALRFRSLNVKAQYREQEVSLSDLPTGERYTFWMYQDENGEFTRCSFVCDTGSKLALSKLYYRIESFDRELETLEVTLRHPDVKDYQRNIVQPLPFGAARFQLPNDAQFWKDNAKVSLDELTPGTSVRLNLAEPNAHDSLRITDIWAVDPYELQQRFE
ncbi:hypothetical protein [Calycomorphotria hydatis]|uniref:Uncharacterized protein n=1 Tax=Calycomorphotria hydatis TaxID=2528027 RepID=A0A517TE92_9PLAN|nr:hypothetical protein [Calycomorphotria hydatis]QDT66686.1 hypothetical protein V22_39570 [Calycomorphotria hydatis]